MGESIFEDLRLVHNTTGRVRLKYKLNRDINSECILSQISAFKWVVAVRINPTASSLIIHYSDIEVKKIIECLYSINIKVNHSVENKMMCVKRQLISCVLSLLILFVFKKNKLLFFLSYLFSFKNLLKGFRSFFKNGISSEFFEGLAIFISLYKKDYFSANITNCLLNLADVIQKSLHQKADALVETLFLPDISKVWVEINNEERLVSYSDIVVGSIVVVNTGDLVPVDGIIVDGNAVVNESTITGELIPKIKKEGSRVFAGSTVAEGKIKIFTESCGKETIVSKIKDTIERNLKIQSQAEIKALELADRLIYYVLLFAGVTYLITRKIKNVLSILQSDYSCALKLSIPLAFKSAVYYLAKHGVLIKMPNKLEKLTKCGMIVFDKTGTLTEGNFVVNKIYSLSENWGEEKILSLAASLEEHYYHPLANAIVKSALEKNYKHFNHSDIEFIVAHGVSAIVNGKKVMIGSRHFLEDDEKIFFSEVVNKIEYNEIKQGSSLLYISFDGELIGVISLKDRLRTNIIEFMKKIKQMNLKTIMLTGDIEERARDLAEILFFDEYYYKLLPHDKLEIIKKLKLHHSIIFIGDGINDSIALLESDVGITIAESSDIAKASADVLLLDNKLEKLFTLLDTAKKLEYRVITNFNISILINSIIIFFSSMGFLSMAVSSGLHNGTTILLLLNSLKEFSIVDKRN